MTEIVEEIARAMHPSRWKSYDQQRAAGLAISPSCKPSIEASLADARAAYEVMARSDGEDWRLNAEFLLSVIDSCDEAEAPSDEMEPEDVANIARIRSTLHHKGTAT